MGTFLCLVDCTASRHICGIYSGSYVYRNADTFCLLLGNLVTDSALNYYVGFRSPSNSSWSPIGAAVWNAGGIRASLTPGRPR